MKHDFGNRAISQLPRAQVKAENRYQQYEEGRRPPHDFIPLSLFKTHVFITYQSNFANIHPDSVSGHGTCRKSNFIFGVGQ